MEIMNFITRSKPNHAQKHMSAFANVVKGSVIYNFAYRLLVHFNSSFWRNWQSNRASWNIWATSRHATAFPHSRGSRAHATWRPLRLDVRTPTRPAHLEASRPRRQHTPRVPNGLSPRACRASVCPRQVQVVPPAG
jgi:hypothetical protein